MFITIMFNYEKHDIGDLPLKNVSTYIINLLYYLVRVNHFYLKNLIFFPIYTIIITWL